MFGKPGTVKVLLLKKTWWSAALCLCLAAAMLYIVNYNSVYQLLNSGALKGYRYGRVWRVPKLAIKEFILENAKLAGREARS